MGDEFSIEFNKQVNCQILLDSDKTQSESRTFLVSARPCVWARFLHVRRLLR